MSDHTLLRPLRGDEPIRAGDVCVSRADGRMCTVVVPPKVLSINGHRIDQHFRRVKAREAWESRGGDGLTRGVFLDKMHAIRMTNICDGTEDEIRRVLVVEVGDE